MVRPFLYIIRHGETPYNAEQRLLGHLDIDLNENGIGHARHMGAYLKGRGIEKIYASPLKRAAHTAEIVAAEIGARVYFEPRLREVRFGIYEGMKIEEAKQHGMYNERDRDRMNYCPPEGESYAQLRVRVHRFIEDTYLFDPGHQPAVVVAHQGVLRMFAAELGLYPPAEAMLKQIGHQSVIIVQPGPNGIAAHLEDV
jgi:broad specificity phosphatase PhoE